MKVYLDNAATTPMHPEVIKVMHEVMSDYFGNPSSIHAKGREVKTLIEDARRQVAKLLGCTPGEIFFTSGGTEADNMAIREAVHTLGVKHIITSPIEHHAVLHTIEELAKTGLIQMHLVNLTHKGHIDTQHLENLLKQNANALVSLMHSNNEIGNMIDLEQIGNLCNSYQAYFHCDTVQTIGHQYFDLGKLNVHFLAGAAHKFNGPKGIGFIYINSKVKIHPFITGGAQERNMRGGTENVYGILGLAKALQLSYDNLEQDKQHISSLKQYMIEQLRLHIPGVAFNGDAEGYSSYTVLNVSFPPTPIAEMLLFKLDIDGICASGGSACSSGSNVGSHVLKAIGSNPDRPAVRFSFGAHNTKTEIDYVIERLKIMLKINESVQA
ncbi:MAG: cysteine desulfurase [Bacteroidia bacterium]|jgi:cysteine desulfurase|nr:cysteine desulfurase [Bacteroidia bacterium]